MKKRRDWRREILLGAGIYFLAAGLVLGDTVPAQAAIWQPGENGAYYLLAEDGSRLTGWQSVDGLWYYLEQDGTMKRGWHSEGDTWYYLEESGAMATGWKRIDGKYYWFRENGAMQNTTLYQDETQYTFDESGGLSSVKKKRNTGGGSYAIGFLDAESQEMADALNELKAEAFDGDEEEDYYEDDKKDYDRDASFVLNARLQEIAEHRIKMARSRGYGSGRIPEEGTLSEYLDSVGYQAARRHMEVYLINCDGVTHAEEKLLRNHDSDEKKRSDRVIYYKEMGIAHESVNGRDYFMLVLMR
ncbi:MAG: N-acetylmuramoyl-L-alanine amidase family protein [Clostridium sp.]|jgi:hypothetical protein